METHRIYKCVIRNDGHSHVQSSEPSQSFTFNFGSLSAQLTIKVFFQKTYSPLNIGSYENKGRKTAGVESRACNATLDTLCLEQKIWLPWKRDITL